MEDIVRQFLDYLQFERNYSMLTLRSYGDNLRVFLSLCESKSLSWKEVTADDIREYMEWLMEQGQSARSVNQRLSTLRSFYRFALARQMVSTDPMLGISGPRRGKPLPQFVKEKELDRLFDELPWGDHYKDVRARTIILLFYTTGIRLAELVGLNVGDVSLTQRQLKVTGKRDKQRVVPFGQEMCDVMALYMEKRSESVAVTTTALFADEHGRRLSRGQVQYLVRKHLALVTTLKKKSPHVLRHSFATAMLNHGAGIESVRKLLGHESIATTEIYTHTTFEQLRDVYRKAHPRASS